MGCACARLMKQYLLPQISALLLICLFGCVTPQEINLESDDVLFHDEFGAGSTGSWILEGDELGQTAVVNEQLHVYVDGPNLMQFATLTEPQFQDFVLTIDARQLAGDLQSSYGVLVRMQDSTRFYRFAVTGDGHYMIERRNGDGGWTRLVSDWTSTPAVNQGLSVANRLRVEAEAATMRFYVNDVLLHQITDAQYAAGMIGVDAGTWGQGGLQVAFDNLVIMRP